MESYNIKTTMDIGAFNVLIKHYDPNSVVRIYRRDMPYMLWAASCIHTILAICMIANSQVPTLLVLTGLDFLHEQVQDRFVMAAILVGFSAVAANGLIREPKLTRWWIVACLIPQYILILLSLITDVFLIINADFQNSMGQTITVNRFVIVAVLGAFLVVSVLHTINVLERYFINWNR